MKYLVALKNFREASLAILSLIVLVTIIVLSGCSQKESLTAASSSRYFVQDLNPPYLDILWVLDDRSPMNQVREHLVSEAQKFFVRLDSIPNDYQMGITTMDMLRNRGALKPANTVLTKQTGTLDQRVALFGSLLSQVINLQTGAENTGLTATLASLRTYFTPRPGVPLVLVFISDGDDFSEITSTTTTDAVDAFAAQVLSLKENKEDLVKAYSINYLPLVSGVSLANQRCATRNNADIDKANTGALRWNGTPWFQDRYFRVARKLKGDTADLCSDFSDRINLSGLRLKTLPNRFKVDVSVSDASKLRVTVVDKNQNTLNIPWTFDSATSEVVFQTAPPEGSSIQILIAPN